MSLYIYPTPPAEKHDVLDMTLWSFAAELMNAGYNVQGTALSTIPTKTLYHAVFHLEPTPSESEARTLLKRAIKSMPKQMRACVVEEPAEELEWSWTWTRNLEVPGGYMNDGTVA